MLPAAPFESAPPAHLEADPASRWRALRLLVEVPPADGTFRPRLQALLESAAFRGRLGSEPRHACAAARYLLELVAGRGQDDPLVHAVRQATVRRLRSAEEAARRALDAAPPTPTLREELRCFLRSVDGYLRCATPG
ncbi:MAG: hypothetical protein AB7N76_03290 [Planctomycetota bacterium]